MAATAESIWAVPVYLPFLQPPLTDEGVAEIEEAIRVTLPLEYLNLLRIQNGGYVRFAIDGMCNLDIVYGIGPYDFSLMSCYWTDDWGQPQVSFSLDGLVPFSGDGRIHLCLDYRDSPEHPSVTFVDIECDEFSVVASSFTDYLEKLQLAFDDMDNVYVLESITDIERIKSQLSLRLSCKFEPLDTLDEVPRHRAQLGTAKSPAWIWIEPNRVPRAFLRTEWAGHERYGQLKELVNRMPGDALQHPELPADSFILEGPSGVPNELIDACADSQIAIRPLREFIDVI